MTSAEPNYLAGDRQIPRKDGLGDRRPVNLPPTPAHTTVQLPSMYKYGAIYADPPWNFSTWSAKGTGRSAVKHYDCINLTELMKLPVGELAADDCALFLWTTDPMLPRALDLIQAWGFQYKTVAFCCVKLNASGQGYFTGMGYWTRANPELCLLATRGKPQRKSNDVRRLVIERRREHSRKPDEVRNRIERLVDGPYIELFARETKPGWDSWGNEVGRFDDGTRRIRRQPSRLREQQVEVRP